VEVQVNVSLASSNAASSAVQAVHEPEVESIWNCTADTVPTASVALPERVGVVSVLGSGVSAVSEMLGAVASLTVKSVEMSEKSEKENAKQPQIN